MIEDFDTRMEAALLAHVLRRPMAARRIGSLRPTDLTTTYHQELYRAIRELTEAGQRADVKSVHAQLKRTGRAHTATWIPRFLDQAPDCESVADAVTFLRDLGDRRSIRAPALEIAAAALNGDLELARRLAGQLAAKTASTEAEADWTWVFTSAEAVEASIADLAAADERPPVDLGRFHPLARALQPGNLIVFGGETNAGKDSLALWAAIKWARSTGSKVGIVSVEDRLPVWGGRLLAYSCGVNPNGLATLTKAQGDALSQGAHKAGEEDLFRFAILERNDVADIEKHMRHLVAQGCTLLVVDYLQECTDESARNAPRHQMLSGISRRIKTVSKQLHVPTVLCSQLSRPSDKRHREPTLFELKGTGDLENQADACVLLWKTSDDSDSVAYSKIAKLKESSDRPRCCIIRGEGGAIRSLQFEAKEDPFSGFG